MSTIVRSGYDVLICDKCNSDIFRGNPIIPIKDKLPYKWNGNSHICDSCHEEEIPVMFANMTFNRYSEVNFLI